ncbi:MULTISPECIES: ATP-binding protein [unclassified Bacillus (in: firmicutes)]|uniref:ATP-binding protein n=1 Tax=unclassified Bacillus (in: firmicutes) TaxID=185979 RepID=UPI0008EC88B4|nr:MULTISPECIES: ATP-binding protein [unclassified Bacillus (in: firmicutes)]SFB06650.1 two-component system, sporulation sensor kinase B [Bacillus sp. UNCCL13]SFQ87623.1 two-component system, sporulation sensor kinase B [Bacillus sp. cl95]
MLETFKVLIVDLFFILVVSIFTEIIVDKKNLSKNKRTYVYSLTYSIALLLNMIFYVRINQEFQVDLRHTALVIAGLYGGVRCLPPMLILLTIYIGIMYPLEAYANALAMIVEVLAIAFLTKYYHNWRLRKKLISLGLATFINGLFIMKTVEYFFSFTTGYDLLIISFYSASLMSIVFMLEWVRNSNAIHERVQRAEKLELVSHLAASISHEVRNPLTVTRGFLQILEREDFTPEKKKEFFSLAKSELDRAESIIRDYLTFAKPYSNKTEPLLLKNEINHVIEIISPLANMNSVSIHTDVKEETIVGEMQLFHQCLLNILKNGIEAMDSTGGTLRVETVIKDYSVDVLISDTGIGMTDAQIKRLGEPYFSTRGKNGTGLGMMVVYSIVQSMKGKITVKSQVGEGTTFILSFPKAS